MPSGGHGLVGLRQQAELLGGRCVQVPPGGGFLIDVALPTVTRAAGTNGK